MYGRMSPRRWRDSNRRFTFCRNLAVNTQTTKVTTTEPRWKINILAEIAEGRCGIAYSKNKENSYTVEEPYVQYSLSNSAEVIVVSYSLQS